MRALGLRIRVRWFLGGNSDGNDVSEGRRLDSVEIGGIARRLCKYELVMFSV